jgi:hypothetical protein
MAKAKDGSECYTRKNKGGGKYVTCEGTQKGGVTRKATEARKDLRKKVPEKKKVTQAQFENARRKLAGGTATGKSKKSAPKKKLGVKIEKPKEVKKSAPKPAPKKSAPKPKNTIGGRPAGKRVDTNAPRNKGIVVTKKQQTMIKEEFLDVLNVMAEVGKSKAGFMNIMKRARMDADFDKAVMTAYELLEEFKIVSGDLDDDDIKLAEQVLFYLMKQRYEPIQKKNNYSIRQLEKAYKELLATQKFMEDEPKPTILDLANDLFYTDELENKYTKAQIKNIIAEIQGKPFKRADIKDFVKFNKEKEKLIVNYDPERDNSKLPKEVYFKSKADLPKRAPGLKGQIYRPYMVKNAGDTLYDKDGNIVFKKFTEAEKKNKEYRTGLIEGKRPVADYYMVGGFDIYSARRFDLDETVGNQSGIFRMREKY